MEAERRLRLFLAVDVPEEADAAADEVAGTWRDRLGGAGRWVARESRHVTVAFLGSTPPGRVARIGERVRDACARVRPFETGFGSLHAVPRAASARMLWLRLDAGAGGWAALASAVRDALVEDLPPERRAFSPHLTLARFQPRVSFAAHDEALRERPGGPRFRVGSVALYRSHLGGAAPRYEELERFRLRG